MNRQERKRKALIIAQAIGWIVTVGVIYVLGYLAGEAVCFVGRFF